MSRQHFLDIFNEIVLYRLIHSFYVVDRRLLLPPVDVRRDSSDISLNWLINKNIQNLDEEQEWFQFQN